MKSVKKWALAAGAALMLGTSVQVASAASINEVILSSPGATLFDDEDYSFVATRDGQGFRIKGAGETVEEDDFLIGVINIKNIDGTPIGVGSSNNELTGLYAVQITDKTAGTYTSSPARMLSGTASNFTAEAAPADVWSAFFGVSFGPDAVVALYDDATPDFPDASTNPSAATLIGAAGDGSLWGVFGGDDAVYNFRADTDLIGEAATAPAFPGGPGGGAFAIVDGIGVDRLPIASLSDALIFNPVGGYDLIGSGSLFGSGPDEMPVVSDLSFTANIVPSPTAVATGLVGLGMLLVGRRRKIS